MGQQWEGAARVLQALVGDLPGGGHEGGGVDAGDHDIQSFQMVYDRRPHGYRRHPGVRVSRCQCVAPHGPVAGFNKTYHILLREQVLI